MKSILCLNLFLLLFFNESANAFFIESGYSKSTSGQYVRETRVTCEEEDTDSCLSLCQNEGECRRQEPFCRNCAGTTSPLLRQLFTEISKLYKVKGPVTNRGDFIQYLREQSYVLLDLKSVFNYYTPIGSEAFLQELQLLCGAGAENSLLAVTLDSVHQPQALKYVLCQKSANQTVPLEVEERQPGVRGQRLLRSPILFQLN